MAQTAFALIAAFLFAGCTLGPDYLRPNFLIPNNHRGIVEVPQAESIADIPWWELFKDPVLQELTREALTNNYDLRTAAARVEEARSQIGVARSFLYPQVSVNGGGSAEQVSRRTEPPQSFGANRTYQNWVMGFSMAWELDVFGRIRREAEAATGVFLATEQARRGVLIALIADVAQSYFILRELDLELEISRRTVGVNDETVEFYRRRVSGGVSNQLEFDQAFANRSRTAATIPELERQIATQENLINFLVGRNPGAIPRGTALTDQYLPPSIPAGLPSALLERRPDVKAAEDLLFAANANIGAAKALFFPNFSLTAALGSASHDLSNIVDRRAAIWSVAGGVLQPVFQGWRIFFNYEATKARFEQAVAQYEKAAQNGFREVADALVGVEKFRESRAELERGVQALANAARLSRLRYDTGLANYLEILIADQQLFDQEILLARARGAQLTTVVQLYRALGGGWQP
ncbi:MAG TPA: efflux transporter outer membrane subunit [Candidatus Deferrimicrobium sp.]|nr:efflux transporter outer membrane subunit [Candidatus Deferrimicrobium sp.]